jgi:pyruvate/2-oxoglutarate dehydrogenase complex dihydrolipoamide dehydrogenase (E3) component
MTETYDLAIVGGGAAGLIAAPFAVQLGARVAFIEKDRIGGDCTWTGCVPSKTLLKAAKLAHQMRTADSYGLGPVEPQTDFKRVMAHVNKVIDDIYRPTSPESLRRKGLEVFLGETRFTDHHTVSVAGQSISANYFLVCTGAHPTVPPIEGLESVNYLTYRNIWELMSLPGHLMVVGAGPIGCELAQAFRRLGSAVTIIEANEKLSDEPEVMKIIASTFVQEGIDLRPNTRAERVWQDGQGIHLLAGGSELAGDALLVAVGRRPSVNGLDLEKAGVDFDEKGIHVDRYLRTSQPHIFAAGDCTGGLQFSHYAGWQGFIAVRNALLPGKSRGITDQVPWTTFTDPEVAHVGLTEEQARGKFGNTVMTSVWPMKKVDRALNEGEDAGFLKLVYRQDGRLLGVTIVAAEAGEMINEWVVAMKQNFKVDKLASAIHVYPTYATASMQASAAVLVERLLGGLKGEVIKRLAHVKR